MNKYKKVVEYIWLDGGNKMQSVRSKSRVLEFDEGYSELIRPDEVPLWNFDGSSCNQAETENSDRLLKPVFTCKSPFLDTDLLCLCEVMIEQNEPCHTNTRSKIMKDYLNKDNLKPQIAFEQEYVIRENTGHISGWPKLGNAAPQGPYYCGVGGGKVARRELAQKHMRYCMIANLAYCGMNAEVMLGQWEYQIGGTTIDALTSCDQLIVSRFILEKLSEEFNLKIDYSPKPVQGDWNGSGMHSNFSTKDMREYPGIEAIEKFCNNLSKKENIVLAINNYGKDLKRRLTGKHETSKIDEFSWGYSDRSKSVRIPINVKADECGYIEDRRPNSNADPYLVLQVMMAGLE